MKPFLVFSGQLRRHLCLSWLPYRLSVSIAERAYYTHMLEVSRHVVFVRVGMHERVCMHIRVFNARAADCFGFGWHTFFLRANRILSSSLGTETCIQRRTHIHTARASADASWIALNLQPTQSPLCINSIAKNTTTITIHCHDVQQHKNRPQVDLWHFGPDGVANNLCAHWLDAHLG